MAIYVDEAVNRYGRMMMCHMLADSTEELLSMVRAIGVNQKWIQNPGQAKEHFDICKSKRAMALKLGAIGVTSRELVRLIQSKRL